MTNPSITKKKETMEEQIKKVLIEHENHTPIYTCRLQISGAIMDLIEKERSQTLSDLRENIENVFLFNKRLSGSDLDNHSYLQGWNECLEEIKKDILSLIKEEE